MSGTVTKKPIYRVNMAIMNQDLEAFHGIDPFEGLIEQPGGVGLIEQPGGVSGTGGRRNREKGPVGIQTDRYGQRRFPMKTLKAFVTKRPMTVYKTTKHDGCTQGPTHWTPDIPVETHPTCAMNIGSIATNTPFKQ